MRNLLVMGIPYQHAPEVSIVRTDTCYGYLRSRYHRNRQPAPDAKKPPPASISRTSNVLFMLRFLS
jgi:hypothetical protein